MEIIRVALVIAILSSGFLAQYAFRKSNTPHSKTLTVMLVLLSCWSIAYFCQLISPQLQAKLIFSNITFAFIPFVPLSWFIFSMQYAGYRKVISIKALWPLLVIPVIVEIGVWSDPVFHWFRDSVSLVSIGPLKGMVVNYSHVFWLHTAYSYLLIFLSIIFIVRKVINFPQVPIVQAMLLLGACFTPLAVNIMYLFVRGSSSDVVDWTPVSLSVSGIMLTYATLRYKLLEPSPVAHKYLFDSLSEGIIVINHENVIIDANPAVQLFVGKIPSEIIGMRAGDLPLLQNVKLDNVGKKHARSITVDVTENKTILCETVVHKFSFDYDNEEGKLVTFRDITYRKRLEDEVAARQKHESLVMLAGGLAHDFNTLLGIIMGNVSLAKLEAKGNPKTMLPLLQEIDTACERAKDLTHQLLSFARGERVNITECSLSDIANRSAALFLSGKKIAFDNNLPSTLWPVKADAGQLERVFQNIIVNAIDAMGDKGVITIDGTNVQLSEQDLEHSISLGRYVKVSIQDSGPGISRKDLPKIFDPYFSTRSDGHGLGLSLVYTIVKRHGGAIIADSTKWGARFTVFLPAV